MKTASPRTGVIQLWMPLSRRAATWLDLGRREGVCESDTEGKVCESVSGPEAPKDVTHAPRERETCCHRKVSILTCSGLWKRQQPLTEVSRCSETMVFI